MIDRHVLGEVLRTLSLSLGAFVGLLLLLDMYDNLKDLIDYGAGVQEVLRYYLVLTPSFLPVVLPLSFMIAILFGLGQLHRNNELTAMRAAGLSLFRITRSIWGLGVLLTILLFFLNASVVPWSVEQARVIWENYAFSAELQEKEEDEIGIIPSLAYYNHSENRLWFINRFSEFNFRAYGITVSQLSPRGREISRIVANEGSYEDTLGYWAFKDGRNVTFDPITGEPVRSLGFTYQAFEQLTDNPKLMKFREERPKDLSFFQLDLVLESLSPRDPDLLSYQVRYYSIAATPIICLLVVGLAVPFAATGVRVNPMVGVFKAIGLFVAYYVVVNIASLLGSQGELPPLLAAWLPTLLGAGVAAWLNFRARFA